MFSSSLTYKRQLGFTLIELMIVVAIIGILTVIAYPSYIQYVTRSYRDSAKACLSEHVQFMERYYTTHLKYVDNIGKAPIFTLSCTTESNMASRYTFKINDVGASKYTATATPIGAQKANDELCKTMSINNKGIRSPNINGCW